LVGEFGAKYETKLVVPSMTVVVIGVAAASYGEGVGGLHGGLGAVGGASSGPFTTHDTHSHTHTHTRAPPDPGELNFNLTGVIFQFGSIATESTRLVLIQVCV
jgi:hypothetical protein